MKKYSNDYIDAYNSVIMPGRNIDTIYSYDRHYDLLPGVVRKEP